ncbi:hypothetical protein [Uliginosibacterium gangwonense]|uniref:hypothetical protein n=1 Tax=Uliginosibacterium gangwonense TaxID=392736 RepID=UPI000372B4A1|nr:hypothetical protein [Uliginosibacterium gangwonense]
MTSLTLLAGSLLTAMLLALNPAHADSTIVILRHGEKPAAGLGQLDCQGLNRSLALAPVLQQRYGTPTALYAPNPAQLKKDHGIEYAYIRPLATIEPYAIRIGQPVNLHWGMEDVDGLADHLKKVQGTHIVAWEHHMAAKLARKLVKELGGDDKGVPKWTDDDFDSLYVIRVKEDSTRKAEFSHEQEGLNNLPQVCPAGAN